MRYIAPKYGIGSRVVATVPVFPVGTVKGVKTRGEELLYLVEFDGPFPRYRELVIETTIQHYEDTKDNNRRMKHENSR